MNTLKELIDNKPAFQLPAAYSAPAPRIPQTTKSILEETELGKLLTKVTETPKADYTTPASCCRIDGNDFVMASGNHMIISEIMPYAKSQLMQRLMPGMNTLDKKLRDDNNNIRIGEWEKFCNTMLQTCGKSFLARTIQMDFDEHNCNYTDKLPKLRALLSNGFLTLDNDFVVANSLPIIQESGMRFKLLSGNVDEMGMFLKFVSTEIAFEVNDNGRKRGFSVGFILKNSEVGQGYCIYEAFVVDRYCDNGAVFGGQFAIAEAKFMHRGSKIETAFPSLVGDEIRNSRIAEHKALIQKATTLACTNSGLSQIKQCIENSVNQPAGDNTEEQINAIKRVANTYHLSQQETTNLQRLAGAESPTRFGVQAAVTELAKTAETAHRKVELEKIGGDVLTNDKDWKKIVADLS